MPLVEMESRIVGAMIERAAFNSMTHGERAFWTGRKVRARDLRMFGTGAPSKPLVLAFSIAVHEALDYGGGKRTGIMLDHNDGFAPHGMSVCQSIHKRRSELAGFHTQRREEFNPLQLADLIAWIWNRHMTTLSTLTPEQEWVFSRIQRKDNNVRWITEEEMRDFCRMLPDELRAVLQQDEGGGNR